MQKYAKTKQEDTIYSKLEMVFIKRFNKLKILFLNPFVKLLDKIGITPNAISIFSALIVVVAFLSSYLLTSPIYFIVGIWLHLIVDGLDGTLARYQHVSSSKGAFVDAACDHFGIVLASVFAYIFGIIDWHNILIFAISYSMLMVVILYMLKHKLSYVLVIRPRFYFYIAITIDIFYFSHITYYTVLMANVVMLIEIVLGVVQIFYSKKKHL